MAQTEPENEEGPAEPTPAPVPTPTAPAPAPAAPPAAPSSGAMLLAQAPLEDEPAPLPSRRTWYGWQNLLGDGASLTMFVLAVGQRDGESLAWSGLATYLVAGPVIHFAHGNVGTGVASFGLRAAAPVAGAMFGCALDDSSGMFGCIGGAALGFLAGHATAVILDSAVLAYEDEATPRRDAKARPIVAPIAMWTPHGSTIGLQGMF